MIYIKLFSEQQIIKSKLLLDQTLIVKSYLTDVYF